MRLPLEVMERLDDTTARLIAGTLAPREIRDEHDDDRPTMCITPAEWRARQVR